MKMNFWRGVFWLLFLSQATSVYSQENVLYSHDYHSGINAAGLSPVQPYFNPHPWEINLAAAEVFFQNDYAYVSQQSLLGLRHAEIRSPNRKKNITGENTADVLDFYNDDFGTFHLSTDIYGPSFSFRGKVWEQSFRAGLFTRLRTQSSAVNVDNYLKFGNQSLPEPPEYLLQPLELSLMNWGEAGLNFSTGIFPYSDLHWIVGGNLKYTAGFDALTLRSRSSILLERSVQEVNGTPQKAITASQYEIESSYSTGYDFDAQRYRLQQNGKGMGADFGFAVADWEEDEETYNFKLALNLLDVGSIRFTGQNHFFAGAPIEVLNNPRLENTRFDRPEKIFGFLSKEVYGDEQASYRGTDFTMGLPTALHLNVSKNIAPQQFLDVSWVQRMPVFENSLRRSNTVSLAYTVQKPVLGYGASVSLYEYSDFLVGAYFRAGPLVLGSENFLPLIFKQKKLHAADFYIAVKLYPFWDNDFKRHRRARCNCD